MNDIAETLRQHRKQKGISQQQLAEQARVSRLLIARLETKRLPEIGFTKLLRILNAVGLDLRVQTLNRSRPTLEDLTEAEDETS